MVQGMERSEKREVYKRSIVYCTNKELAFDYLRDSLARTGRTSKMHLSLERLRGVASPQDSPVLRGLYFAIVDEADSVFIDEARTPLILAASVGAAEEAAVFRRALALAERLTTGTDYILDVAERYAGLSHAGCEKIAGFVGDLDGVWTSERAREELVTQALTALLLFHRDQHYVVADGKIQIVDESTGRVMPDRSWERGLHQMIAVKVACEPTQSK